MNLRTPLRALAAFCVALPLLLAAQRHVVVLAADSVLPKKWMRPVQVAAPELVPGVVNAQIAFLHGKGYLEASCDTCLTVGDTSVCPFQVGRAYRWARLSDAGVPEEIASEAGFRPKLYTDTPIDPRKVGDLLNTLLRNSENRGHPFAKVWLDSLRPQGDGLSAAVMLDQGRLVRYDSVVVKGDVRTSTRYLQASIGIRPGDLYNEELLTAVEKRLKELPFITQKRRPYVQFTPESTKLYLFLDTKKASSINGILGLQPDAVTGKVNLTGDLDLRL